MAYRYTLRDREFHSFSNAENARRMTTYAEDYLVRGYNHVHLDFDVLPDGVTYFLFDPTACSSTCTVFAMPIEVSTPEGPVQIEWFKDTTSYGGTEMSVFNPSTFDDSPTPNAVFTRDPTFVDTGDKVYGISVGGAATRFSTNSGSANVNMPKLLDSSKKYLYKFNNTTGGPITLDKFYLSWYEVPSAE